MHIYVFISTSVYAYIFTWITLFPNPNPNSSLHNINRFLEMIFLKGGIGNNVLWIFPNYAITQLLCSLCVYSCSTVPVVTFVSFDTNLIQIGFNLFPVKLQSPVQTKSIHEQDNSWAVRNTFVLLKVELAPQPTI